MRKIYSLINKIHIEYTLGEILDKNKKYRIVFEDEPTKHYITYSGQVFRNDREICGKTKGYKKIMINGVFLYLHHIIFICFGNFLQDEKYKKIILNDIKNISIDHIDNNRSNNSYDNLQAISHQENVSKNPKTQKRNTAYSFKNDEEFNKFQKDNENIKNVTYTKTINNIPCKFNNLYYNISTRDIYVYYKRKIQIKLYTPYVCFDNHFSIYDENHIRRRINYKKLREYMIKQFEENEEEDKQEK